MARCEVCRQEMTRRVGCKLKEEQFADGKTRPRIPYGEEGSRKREPKVTDWPPEQRAEAEAYIQQARALEKALLSTPFPPYCPDCEVPRGSMHHVGCDVELCPKCGRQALGCDCYDATDPEADDQID